MRYLQGSEEVQTPMEMARVCCKVSLFVTARLLWEGAVT